MAYPHTPKLEFPLKNYKVNSYDFMEECTYDDVYWGFHLGEDINKRADTKVMAIGRGRVVYSALHPGTKEHSNWGNIIIIAHKHPKTKQVFFSLYAHMKERLVEKGDRVNGGDIIGSIGKANTPENGMWHESHLHFSIYTGPWKGKVLPGYYRKDQKLTKRNYWKRPSEFIERYKA
ncbi:MAG: M23 family metallopeptidase [Candidatus Spechtbacterales bacterium]|nr:M23 family metallopeptidase [Candidatus Spechtbacterales bacterium]